MATFRLQFVKIPLYSNALCENFIFTEVLAYCITYQTLPHQNILRSRVFDQHYRSTVAQVKTQDENHFEICYLGNICILAGISGVTNDPMGTRGQSHCRQKFTLDHKVRLTIPHLQINQAHKNLQ